MEWKVLDDWNKEVPRRRQMYYGCYALAVVVLVWGTAYLHTKNWIDAIPLPESYWVRGEMLFLTSLLVLLCRQIVQFQWLGAIVLTILVMLVLTIVLVFVLEGIGLDAASLSLRKEFMRLTIICIIYIGLSLLPIELLYQSFQKKLKGD